MHRHTECCQAMFSKDVQTPRASQPLFCENQCQKVTTTKMLKQNSPCKPNIPFNLRRKKWQDLKSFSASVQTKCHRENPRAGLVWTCNTLWEPGVSSGRNKIIHSIYISKSLCMPRSLSKRYIFITLIFHLQWGGKKTLQNYYRSNVLSQIQLKSEIISELF